jgi:hypothetical protein
MAGLVPAIHVLGLLHRSKGVDARHKAGHDAARILAEHFYFICFVRNSCVRLQARSPAALL